MNTKKFCEVLMNTKKFCVVLMNTKKFCSQMQMENGYETWKAVTCEENLFFYVGSAISEIMSYRKFAGTAGKSHYKVNKCLWLVN